MYHVHNCPTNLNPPAGPGKLCRESVADQSSDPDEDEKSAGSGILEIGSVVW
jgi:hypothetical protein